MADAGEPLERRLFYDGVVHNPLGGGSYVFERGYVDYIAKNLSKGSLRISIGAQPNSSPHFGTLVVFSLAYALGQKIFDTGEIKPDVLFEVIDTAPSETRKIDGIDYQISLRDSGTLDTYLNAYSELLRLLGGLTGVSCAFRKQKDFNSQSAVPNILKDIVQNREVTCSYARSSK